jgi:signal transduction histidine kinase
VERALRQTQVLLAGGRFGGLRLLRSLGNIRYQIALILLLAIAPLALLAVYLAVDNGRKDAARARADSREAVRLVALDLNRVIQSSSDLVQGLSRYSVIRDPAGSCDAELAALKPAFPQFVNMFVVDTDSRVLCAASNPMNVRTLQDYPEDLALLDRVRRSGQVAVGDFVLTSPGKRVVPVVGPVMDEDHHQVRSFVFVTVDLDWLDKQINKMQIPAEATLLVMDGQGREIARNPRSPDWPAGTPAPPLERTLVGKNDFDGEVKGYDGISRFYSVARVRSGDDLLVVMKIRLSEIYRPAKRRLALHLSGLGIVGLLVLGLTWLGSGRYFTRPLSRLIETANRLASGSLDARTGLEYRGEIGVLAKSFDQMADALEQNQIRETQAAEEKARLRAQLNQAQKMESVGRLAGGVAHDFNNLLTVINGYSKTLMQGLNSPQRRYAEQINKAGESAASLTRQLLAFSRMEVTHPEKVHLNAIVAESREMLERMVGRHIEMKTSLQASPDSVLADPNQIQQCLMNLAVNARDAMPAGGKLTIETGNAGVRPRDIPIGSSGAPGPHVRLTVRDTGVGMDEETRQRIFEPFFTTKEKGTGTGLGLSTVHGIVSQWQGFVDVGSAPGKGSEFSIYLPLTLSANSQPNAPAAETTVHPAASETVLVVEDQDVVREFVVESLRTYGYSVLQARNGAEALRIIERTGAGIHLMMIDIMMPGMRGSELATRANAVCPSMKVLLMTGCAEGSANEMEWLAEKDAVIMKPFGPEVLEARVRNLLHPLGA